MRVITRTRLVEFWRVHPESHGPLSAWETATKRASWTCSGDVKKTFRNADWVKGVWVFDASRFRILGTVQYQRVTAKGLPIPGIVFIKGVMTHVEYDQWTAANR